MKKYVGLKIVASNFDSNSVRQKNYIVKVSSKSTIILKDNF